MNALLSSPLLLSVWVTSPPSLFLRLLLLLSWLSDSPAPSAPRVFFFFLSQCLLAVSAWGQIYRCWSGCQCSRRSSAIFFFLCPPASVWYLKAVAFVRHFPFPRFSLSAGNILTRSAAPINSPPQWQFTPQVQIMFPSLLKCMAVFQALTSISFRYFWSSLLWLFWCRIFQSVTEDEPTARVSAESHAVYYEQLGFVTVPWQKQALAQVAPNPTVCSNNDWERSPELQQ